MQSKRWYETTFIVNAGLEDTAVNNVVESAVEYLKNNGGEIETIDKWGRKRLAYPINKKNNGYYVYILHNSAPTLPPLMERYFHLDENVIRHLTVFLEGRELEFRRKKLQEKDEAEESGESSSNAKAESDKANGKASASSRIEKEKKASLKIEADQSENSDD